MVKSEAYDLVLVDLMMPVMGGLELMEHVNQIDQDIIMIVVTGFATIETAVEAMKRGAYDYLPKPFSPDQLTAVVNRGLEKRRLSLRAKTLMEERDQKLLEVANEKSKMHTIVNSMADGILVINMEKRLVLWNPAAMKMLNIDEHLEPGGDIREIIPHRALTDVIMKAFSTDSGRYTTVTEEIEMRKPDSRTLMVSVPRIRDEEGNELGVVSTLRDITKLKEVEQVKSQFVSMVTHELRAPLAAIEGYLTAYLTGAVGDDPKVNRQMLERARQRSHSLLDLVSDLLQYSRLESKRVERKKEPIDISEIIVNTLELLKNQGVSKELKFQVDLPESLPPIEADRSEMEQILTNLISNAIKYNVKQGAVRVSARAGKGFLDIKVADTGIGIDEENLQNVFDEFFRVSGPHTRYTAGTGLGLSIVKKIVESYFGRIDVESELDKGTTFTVKLPIKYDKNK